MVNILLEIFFRNGIRVWGAMILICGSTVSVSEHKPKCLKSHLQIFEQRFFK